MHSVRAVETESAPKCLMQVQAAVTIVPLVVLVALALLVPAYATTTMRVGGRSFVLQVADDDATRERGLSGRRILARDGGMLFAYNQSGQYCYWMEDMRFSLDMLWLNASKQVTYIKSDATPGSYPQQFCPPSPSQYVIELNAGTARAVGVHIGQTINFYSPDVLY